MNYKPAKQRQDRGKHEVAAVETGARGCVLKEDIPGILEAVKQVQRGGTFVSRALRQH